MVDKVSETNYMSYKPMLSNLLSFLCPYICSETISFLDLLPFTALL